MILPLFDLGERSNFDDLAELVLFTQYQNFGCQAMIICMQVHIVIGKDVINYRSEISYFQRLLSPVFYSKESTNAVRVNYIPAGVNSCHKVESVVLLTVTLRFYNISYPVKNAS